MAVEILKSSLLALYFKLSNTFLGNQKSVTNISQVKCTFWF